MLDAFTASQQEAVGLVGVNLIYGAHALLGDCTAFMKSLMDGLDRRRIEIDLIKFSGPAFPGVDNRIMSLQLVELGLTDVAMFLPSGEVVQPSEVLHNRPVLIERGSFGRSQRHPEHVGCRAGATAGAPDRTPDEPSVVMEMTLNNLMAGPSIDHQDFLARVDILSALEKTVMISNYTRFDRVTTYLRQYTQNRISMVVGIPTLREIFEEKYYEELLGGILEGLGQLFRGSVKLFVYPTLAAGTGEVESADKLEINPKLKDLYAYLFDNGFIEPVRHFSTEQLAVSPGDVLRKIEAGDPAWMNFVPETAAALIERDKLFGLGSGKENP